MEGKAFRVSFDVSFPMLGETRLTKVRFTGSCTHTLYLMTLFGEFYTLRGLPGKEEKHLGSCPSL